MKPSNLVKAAAAAGIAVGLSAFAAPAAFADIYYTPDGDISVQNTDGVASAPAQSAENELDTEIVNAVEDSVQGLGS
ncbi:hypothetical protein MOQ72_39890 [Saccharopolyspora sp. K220]|uniref:hypothetical protein n=1 Tax=Saccharopolyspora soli TaxID=2926618 RepID=UPI001F5789CA|nr:hypothetical protein [Saccharopolyspora soli]MCI2423585.1 hypothetical protein [Saccharopolyspora soli]